MVNPKLLKGEKLLDKIQPPKYEKTKLDNEYLKNITTQLQQLNSTEKIFLESDIRLEQIAGKLSIPKHHITQALNLHLGKSFYEYINQLRIEHAQNLLNNLPEGDNVKTVMFASGFNNRASFNNNFKKFTGKTASQYLKDQLIEKGGNVGRQP